MRRSVVFPTAALAVALVVAGCSPTAPATPTPTPVPTPPPDAPSVLAAASKATYPSKLEITLGGSFTSAGATTSLPDKLLTIDVDTAAGTGSIHVAIPVSVLGTDGAAVTKQLGVTGDSITFDALYDGTAIYAKSPAMPFLVSQLATLAAGTTLPTMTADTWAKLIDAATLKQLASSATGAVASAAPVASASTTDMLAALGLAGATLSLGPQTTGAGGPASDVKLTLDPAKLMAYMQAHPEQFPSSQLSTIEALGTLKSLSADVLVDVATSRVEQVSFSIGASQGGSDVSVTATVGIAEAPAGVSFAAPAGAVDLPLVTILAPLIQSLMGSGGLGLPIPSTAP